MPMHNPDLEKRLSQMMGILRLHGFPAGDVRLIDDLGTHAAEQALGSVHRVAQTAPAGMASFVMLNAMLRLSDAGIGMLDTFKGATSPKTGETTNV